MYDVSWRNDQMIISDHIATMQNRFLKLDIFSISVFLDRLFLTDIGDSDRFS